MYVVFPMIVMLLFCALYAGAYIWMRRPKFGESEGDPNAWTDETGQDDSGPRVEADAEGPIDSKNP